MCSGEVPWGSEDRRRTRLAVSREELIWGTESMLVSWQRCLWRRIGLTEGDDGIRICESEKKHGADGDNALHRDLVIRC